MPVDRSPIAAEVLAEESCIYTCEGAASVEADPTYRLTDPSPEEA